MKTPGSLLGTLIVFFISFLNTDIAVAASPLSLTYQGRILRPDGTPLDSSNVRFTVEIRSYNDCLLYREIQSVNLSTSSGVFSLNIGSAPVSQTFNYVGASLAAVFTNHGSFTGLGGCTGGVYTPNVDDNRQILVSFEDMTLGSPTVEIIPTQTVSYVPFAIESYQIAGYTSQNLLRVDGGTATALTPANFTELMNLLNGTSTQYVSASNNGVTSIAFSGSDFTGGTIVSTGTVALKDVVTGATKGTATKVPQITYDNKGRITAVTEVDITGTAPSGSAGGDLSGAYPNPTIAAGKIDTAKLADDSVTSAKIKDGEIVNADISPSAGIVDTKLATIATAGKVANSATTGVSTNTANTLVLRDNNGDFSSRNITATQINSTETYATDFYLRNAGNNTAKFNLDPAVNTNFNIVWPDNAGSSGKFLTNDGNGTLSWSSAGASSQWNTSGSNIYYNTGNVGVGTASAFYPLSVAGASADMNPIVDITATSTGTYGRGVRLLGPGMTAGQDLYYSVGKSEGTNDSGQFGYHHIADGSSNNFMTIGMFGQPMGSFMFNGAGNVAIGTSGGQPQSRLDVNGGISVGSYAANYAAPVNGLIVSGNVGIGTNNPTEKLEVNGNIKATQLCIGTDCRSTWPSVSSLDPNNLSSAVPITKGGTGQTTALAAFDALSPLTTKGDLVTQNGTNNVRLPAGADYKYLRANSSQTLGLEYSDVTAIDLASLSSTGIVKRTGAGAYATLGVQAPLVDSGTDIGLSTGNGLTVSSGSLVVDAGTGANQIPQLDSSGKLNVSVIPSGVATQWTKSGTSLSYSGGTVGIGITNPAARLGIIAPSGSSSNAEWATTNAIVTQTGTTSGNQALYFGNDSTNNISFIQSVKIGTGGAPLILNANGGRVGIGTNNPLAVLDVRNGDILNSTPTNGTGGTKARVSGDGGIALTRPQDASFGNINGYIDFTGTSTTNRIYYNESSNMMYFTNGANAKSTFSGNVGIGTTNPTASLTVANSVYGQTVMKVSTTAGGTTGIDISEGAGGAMPAGLNVSVSGNAVVANTTSTNGIAVAASGYGGNSVGVLGNVGGAGIGVKGVSDASGGSAGYFKGTSSAYGLIVESGKSGIGTTAPSEQLHVVGNLRVQGSTDCTLGNGSGGTNCSSDIRLKNNVTEIEDSLNKILSLRGVEFDWNEKSQSPGKHSMGVIAQEVEKVFPTAVIEDSKTGYKKVDYAVLVAPLIQAFKSLQADNEYLKKENDSLKQQNAAIAKWICDKDPRAEFCK